MSFRGAGMQKSVSFQISNFSFECFHSRWLCYVTKTTSVLCCSLIGSKLQDFYSSISFCVRGAGLVQSRLKESCFCLFCFFLIWDLVCCFTFQTVGTLLGCRQRNGFVLFKSCCLFLFRSSLPVKNSKGDKSNTSPSSSSSSSFNFQIPYCIYIYVAI